MSHKPLAQEHIPDDEAAAIEQLIAILSKKIIAEKEGDNVVRRDAHPKMHGLVKADFIIEANLRPELAVGLFAKPATYPAWIRFSNQNAKRQADNVRDIRGMAVKLMGVPGKKLLEGEEDASTHDFVTISSPKLVSTDAGDFLALLKAFTKNPLEEALFCLTHPKTTLTILTTFKNFACPLKTRYWSTTPYLFGDGRAVKYCFTPQVITEAEDTDDLGENFLRESMVTQLNQTDAWFDFCVQFQTDADKMPIEDANAEWDEKVSPFHKIATVRIHPQQFDNAARDQYGEHLSFNPWHALPEHRPLGGVNRARRKVYAAISKVRHGQNGVARMEPDHYEID
jgi:catalase